MKLHELLAFDEIIIQCHDNPDADALASGFAVYHYLRANGKKARIVYGGRNIIRKSNLKLMIQTLGIPIEHVERLNPPQLLVTVDCQYGSGNVTHFDAQKVAIIDHHRVCVELPEYSEIRSSLGSCATLVWTMLKEEGFDINEHQDLATALYFGLYTDTNNFGEIAHPLDKDLRDEANFSRELMTRYRNANISLEELETAGAALMQSEYNEDYRFAIVKAGACDPNVLGIISDLLLEVDMVDICLVFSVQKDGVKISVRSCVKEVKANELADEICKGIGSGGGHFAKAGGFIYMKLLNEAYQEYCIHREIEPRMELSEDGRSEHLTASAMKSFLLYRMKDYFRNSRIIYAKDYEIDTSDMDTYQGKPVMLGYVDGKEMFPVGTSVTVRTIEEDIDTTIEEDTVIMIGIKGEVYLSKRDTFVETHHQYDEPYVLERAEYVPTIRDSENERVVCPLDFAKVCIPCERSFVKAKRLKHTVKIFTQWDESKYLRGKPGDYLVVKSNDIHDIVAVEQSIFEKTYQKIDQGVTQKDVKAVVFDLDGTLLDTLEDLKNAVNVALSCNEMPERTLEEVRRFVGNGVRKLMIRAVPEGEANPEFEATFSDFKKYYASHCNVKTSLYPGIRLLLEELKLRGIKMAVVSNKLDSAVKNLCRQYFADYITTAYGETDQIARKPAPDAVFAALNELGVTPDEALYVGDSDVDIATAKNAGMECISVTWGFRDREFLKKHGASTLIDFPTELLSYL